MMASIIVVSVFAVILIALIVHNLINWRNSERDHRS